MRQTLCRLSFLSVEGKKRWLSDSGGPIIGLGGGGVLSADGDYGDGMARVRMRPGTASGILISLLLTASGCHKEGMPPVAVEPQAPDATVVPEGATSEQEAEQAVREEVVDANAPVELALRFSPGEVTTCKVTTEGYKSVEWRGPVVGRPAGSVDGRSGTHVEITFDQRVRDVRADGGAVLAITIKDLKYAGEHRNKVVLDFDSARPEDSANPLAALIGKGYTLILSPGGQVLAVEDVEAARGTVPAGPGQATALRLLSEEQIRRRHEIPPLMALKEGSASPGRTWSDIRTFSFGDMGLKAYERIYTLQAVADGPAVVEMKAILSSAAAQEMHEQQTAGPMSGMFDNVDDYAGRLELDLDSGQVRMYDEQMRIEWVIVDPATAQESRPVALTMGATRLHRLERVQ